MLYSNCPRPANDASLGIFHLLLGAPESPPPPYREIVPQPPHEVRKKAQRRLCIFCGKSYARTATIWNHLDAYLKTLKGGLIYCPRCAEVSDNKMAFKAHAAREHSCYFRPTIKLLRSGSSHFVTDPAESRSPSKSCCPRRRIILVKKDGP